MKKGFISIVTLFVLLVLSLTISFVYKQNINTSEYSKDLYNKKQAQYLSESIINKYLTENYDQLEEIILKDSQKQRKIKGLTKTDSYNLNTNQSVVYKGVAYNIKVSHVYREDEVKLQDVYRISLADINIKVGNSKANSDIWFKIIDDEENLKNNGKKIKIIIKHTY
ncbi:hypothetical protein [uncultured Anaerococcus sp.]|uniref:hypothetical protein n=1 Tax=uncultured Anaerococcus sp. TaxID=293428 RepID=UPI0026120B06|nr:hypothetical protein [uncultured Anaerococcus sp.]